MAMTMERKGGVHSHHQGLGVQGECLALMDEVRDTGDTIMITKNGEPVAELRAAKRPRKSLWGSHAGQIEIRGDLDESVYETGMRGE
jgi:antitoxin (DNA-binding transcriptional repressor) of toxin-antitoxin stability system